MFENFFRRLTGRKTAGDPAAATPPAAGHAKAHAADEVAPGTDIHYHPELIARLQADHKVLLGLFGRIKTAHAAGDTAQAAMLLVEFRNALQEHLLVESVRLYVYLEHQARNDEERFALVHNFRHEMGAIGKAAVAFLAKYADLASDPQLAATFGADLDAVGSVLAQRIHREETLLYPMYEAG